MLKRVVGAALAAITLAVGVIVATPGTAGADASGWYLSSYGTIHCNQVGNRVSCDKYNVAGQLVESPTLDVYMPSWCMTWFVTAGDGAGRSAVVKFSSSDPNPYFQCSLNPSYPAQYGAPSWINSTAFCQWSTLYGHICTNMEGYAYWGVYTIWANYSPYYYTPAEFFI